MRRLSSRFRHSAPAAKCSASHAQSPARSSPVRASSPRVRAGRPLLCTLVKAVILAGGFGSRLSEETTVRPKPMVEIGGKPMLWHIMKLYSAHGIDEFVICLGYK
ncbi:MAG TPA: sugar phosphate nucleotidyltransferase, partial [Solirubrobacteraceae bacterium]|nr:sugar phosphate nucleotidyltransferase [Solirubrobacteraceae bacterium]